MLENNQMFFYLEGVLISVKCQEAIHSSVKLDLKYSYLEPGSLRPRGTWLLCVFMSWCFL